MLPIGGPKGYALALVVELLCSALSDCEPGFEVTYDERGRAAEHDQPVLLRDESGRLRRPPIATAGARRTLPTRSRAQSRSRAHRRRACPARAAPGSTARTGPRASSMFDNSTGTRLKLVADVIEKRSA